MQITDRSREQRHGLLLGIATHHEDWRRHAKVADALQQVEAAYPWHDHVQQDEIELLP